MFRVSVSFLAYDFLHKNVCPFPVSFLNFVFTLFIYIKYFNREREKMYLVLKYFSDI